MAKDKKPLRKGKKGAEAERTKQAKKQEQPKVVVPDSILDTLAEVAVALEEVRAKHSLDPRKLPLRVLSPVKQHALEIIEVSFKPEVPAIVIKTQRPGAGLAKGGGDRD